MTIRALWMRLGQPGAVGLRTALLFIPAGIIGPLFFDRGRAGGSFAAWLVVAIVGELVLIACYCLAGALIHRRGDVSSHPVQTLIAMSLSAAVRGLSIAVASYALGLVPTLELGYRVVAGFFFVTSVLLILAIVVSSYDRHRRTVESLDAERARLLDLRATAAERLDGMRSRILQQVHDSVNPRLQQFDAALNRIAEGADPSPSVDALRSFVEEDLRPLSHRLGTERAALDARPDHTAATPRPRVPLPDRLPVAQSFKPLASGFLCLAASIPPAIRMLEPWRGALFVIAFSLVSMALLLLVRLLVGRWNANPAVALCVVTISYMAIGLLAIKGVAAVGIASPPFLEVPAIIFCGLVGAMNVGYDAFTARQEATEDLLRNTVAELHVAVSSLNQQAWVTQRRLAYVMHGRVQSTLHAAALRLASTPAPSTDLVDGIRRDIAAALAELEVEEQPQVSVSATLDQIADLWQGACSVDWSLTPAAEAVLEQQPVTTQCVIEICREAISNAVHHGHAKQVTCDVDCEGPVVAIRVVDDGSGWNEHAAKGLGARMYDELCASWSVAPETSGTRLLASVALASGQRAHATTT